MLSRQKMNFCHWRKFAFNSHSYIMICSIENGAYVRICLVGMCRHPRMTLMNIMDITRMEQKEFALSNFKTFALLSFEYGLGSLRVTRLGVYRNLMEPHEISFGNISNLAGSSWQSSNAW